MSTLLRKLRWERTSAPQPVYKGVLNLWEAFRFPPIGDASRNDSVRPPARPPLDVRFYEWSPGTSWLATVVIDPIVRKWIPVFTTELKCEVSKSRGRLDVRYYEWSPEFTWVLPVLTPIIARWTPAFVQEQRSGVWTPARPVLNLRGYDIPDDGWVQTAVTNVLRTWIPAFNDRVNYRPSSRPLFDVRQHEWTAELAWIFSSVPSGATTAQVWPAILTGATLAERMAGRAVVDVRQWAPDTAWLARVVDATVAQWASVFMAELGTRTPGRPGLDVRGCEWTPEGGWVFSVVDSVTATWASVWSTEVGVRTGDRRVLDVRPEWAPPSAWMFSALSSTTTTAQQWPAILQGLQPDRTGLAHVLDVRVEGAAQPAWIQRVVEGVVSQWSPIFTGSLAGRRSDTPLTWRPADSPQPAWIFTVLGGVSTAQLWPAIWQGLQPGWTGRPNTGRLPDEPTRPWMATVVDGIVRTWAPSFRLDVGRVGGDRRWDVRGDVVQPAWITSLLAVVAVALQWPAMLLGLQPSYRSGARDRLDVRGHEWAPQSGWVARVVDGVVSTWSPVFDAEFGVRSVDRPLFDARVYSWTPLIWPLPPHGATVAPGAGDIILLRADDLMMQISADIMLRGASDDASIHVGADDMVIQVDADEGTVKP